MPKYALRGFANLSFFPVTKDTVTEYTATPKTPLIGARSCTTEDTRNEFKIPGDDGIYEQGSDYESTTLTIGVNEMQLKDLSTLIGADFEAVPGELNESEIDNAPAVALTYSALNIDGGYRMYRYYNAKLTAYRVDLRAKLDTGNEVNQYQLTFLCSARQAPGTNNKKLVRTTKDAEDATGLTWLDTIPAVTVSP